MHTDGDQENAFGQATGSGYDPMGGAATGADHLKETAQREFDAAKEMFTDTAERVKSEAAGAGGTIATLVMEELDRRKDGLRSEIEDLAAAVRRSTATGGTQSRLAGQAVQVLEDVGVRLRTSSSSDLANDIADFGRANPGTFIATCVLAGLAAGRFLISTASAGSDQRGTPYGNDRMGEGQYDFANRAMARPSGEFGGFPDATR